MDDMRFRLSVRWGRAHLFQDGTILCLESRTRFTTLSVFVGAQHQTGQRECCDRRLENPEGRVVKQGWHQGQLQSVRRSFAAADFTQTESGNSRVPESFVAAFWRSTEEALITRTDLILGDEWWWKSPENYNGNKPHNLMAFRDPITLSLPRKSGAWYHA